MKTKTNAANSPSLGGSGDPAAPDFQADKYLFIHIGHLYHQYDQAITRALKSTGTDRTRWRILMALAHSGTISMKDICELTNIKQSTVSKAIDRMRGDAWLLTEARQSDSRFVDVNLLPRGREALSKLMQAASKVYNIALADIPVQDTVRAIGVLRHIMDNLKNH